MNEAISFDSATTLSSMGVAIVTILTGLVAFLKVKPELDALRKSTQRAEAETEKVEIDSDVAKASTFKLFSETAILVVQPLKDRIAELEARLKAAAETEKELQETHKDLEACRTENVQANNQLVRERKILEMTRQASDARIADLIKGYEDRIVKLLAEKKDQGDKPA